MFRKLSPISDKWIDAAKAICENMQPIVLEDDPIIRERQIWSEVERVGNLLGYDVHYWPENLVIVPDE